MKIDSNTLPLTASSWPLTCPLTSPSCSLMKKKRSDDDDEGEEKK